MKRATRYSESALIDCLEIGCISTCFHTKPQWRMVKVTVVTANAVAKEIALAV